MTKKEEKAKDDYNTNKYINNIIADYKYKKSFHKNIYNKEKLKKLNKTLNDIEKTRQKLNDLIVSCDSLTDIKIIELSQELDILLNKYEYLKKEK
ncbi:Spo0E like sporulation regulatory protein [Gottschalkia purinilytica]|uniref:Spo0E like sporulation regulatory protein n=1 Tax=Gottschalkia purinilytica TaxID=1503 RepID=A0A0L0W8S5_GOTPU|nr:aspartyl-phosphate phosphatase Spo0E family protein [Gottschalkia purinilytica]KNF07846.1 Spo0E like sporulation regulatory protein [Gottschalkia purinilytica]